MFQHHQPLPLPPTSGGKGRRPPEVGLGAELGGRRRGARGRFTWKRAAGEVAEGLRGATLGAVQLASPMPTFGLAGRGGVPPAPLRNLGRLPWQQSQTGNQSPPHSPRGLTFAPRSFESHLGPAGPRPRGHPGSLRAGSLTLWLQHRAPPAIGLISGAAWTRWKIPSSWLVTGPLVFLERRLTLKLQRECWL